MQRNIIAPYLDSQNGHFEVDGYPAAAAAPEAAAAVVDDVRPQEIEEMSNDELSLLQSISCSSVSCKLHAHE